MFQSIFWLLQSSWNSTDTIKQINYSVTAAEDVVKCNDCLEINDNANYIWKWLLLKISSKGIRGEIHFWGRFRVQRIHLMAKWVSRFCHLPTTLTGLFRRQSRRPPKRLLRHLGTRFSFRLFHICFQSFKKKWLDANGGCMTFDHGAVRPCQFACYYYANYIWTLMYERMSIAQWSNHVLPYHFVW